MNYDKTTMDFDGRSSSGLGTAMSCSMGTSTSTPIDSSNVGFKLLLKHGWKEGTGLGVWEQGRLEPLEAVIKKNKRGLGADKTKTVVNKKTKDRHEVESNLLKRRAKGISKKLKKVQEFEEQMREKEFDRAFFREFWTDNI